MSRHHSPEEQDDYAWIARAGQWLIALAGLLLVNHAVHAIAEGVLR